MNVLTALKNFWKFLKKDTWQSWLVSLVLAFLIIKFVFFPVMSFVFATPLPLVVVESCSMYHAGQFDSWWDSNEVWYGTVGITKRIFTEFPFKNGLNKGDIILVSGRGEREVGDIIIFESDFKFPLIHRLVVLDEEEGVIGTKGDNNFDQLPQEEDIPEEKVMGKAIVRIPGLGWAKLIFFEFGRPDGQKGFCK